MPTPIIDRVKKRIETDLDDPELQLIIDEANNDIINSFGPHANNVNPIVQDLEGQRKMIVLDRQVDTSQTITVVEYLTEFGWGETPYTLVAADYRIWSDGYTMERLTTGPNSRWAWGDRVRVTYIPVNDGDQREEVIIKLAILAVQYQGSFAGRSTTQVGEVSMSDIDYTAEREKLMSSLAPRGSLYMA